MIDKKSLAMLFILLALFLTISGVSAQASTDPAEIIKSLITNTQNIGREIFNAILTTTNTTTDSDLFAKILIFLLSALLVYNALELAGNPLKSETINTFISILIPILGIRFLPDGFLAMIALPSTALVALPAIVIPFVIAVFLIERITNRTTRKIILLSYIILMLALLWYNISKDFSWIYIAVAVASAILLTADGTIQAWWEKEKSESAVEEAEMHSRREISLEIIKWKKRLGEATSKKEVEEINNIIYGLEKSRAAFDKKT